MATLIRTSDAPEFQDGRAEASRRLSARLTVAEILSRVVPPMITVYPDAGANLLSSDANDAACDLIEELDALGYAIVRRAAA